MITVEKFPEITNEYALYLSEKYGKLLFFDIETTGLSASSSSVYLIGCMYPENGRFILKQFMAESLSQELPVIQAFFSLAEKFDTLVHFNGDTFDIRYLETAAVPYRLESPLSSMKSIDILRSVRRHRRLLSLPNCRLKTIEEFLGIFREDRYSGGELIEVYERFSRTQDAHLKELLLLHNEEDIEGMMRILPVLLYDDVLSSPDERLEIRERYTDAAGNLLFVSAGIRPYMDRFRLSFPARCDGLHPKNIRAVFEKDEVLFTIPVQTGTMKYFYPDYRNYYYLPREGHAIHKKVGQFVDKDYRIQAVRENCYSLYKGIFAPKIKKEQMGFGSDWNSRDDFTSLTEENLPEYLKAVLSSW